MSREEREMKAEIIAVGDEIVTGNTINTNASYIAKKIQTIGINPQYHSVVRDATEEIKEALNRSLGRADVIFITGGLGPTKDDLTKEAVCECLNRELVVRTDILQNIEAFFKRLNRTMPKSNKKQAAFPKDAYILQNDHGTAPGCILLKETQYIVLLPGPPKEMKPMLDGYVLPYFSQKIQTCYHTLDIKLFGIGESEMAEKAAKILGDFGDRVVAPYVGQHEVIVRITTYGQNQEEAVNKAENLKNAVKECLGEYIIGYNEDKLEEKIFELLKKHSCKVATAESCTGGMIAAALVGCSGISSYFNEGIITYSNEAKIKYLQVSEETLKAYGAVSKETAKEMAEGILRKADADIGLSATGIAGPNGGSEAKPVGLVYIGLAVRDKAFVYELRLGGSRQEIREKTVKNILVKLYQYLLTN